MCDPYYTNKSIRDFPPSIQTDAMSKRLSSILDSLAAVLVSRENKEVISVGFRLGPTNEIVLSIADNKPVGLNIETHARDLWHRITKLSKGFRNYQKEHHMKFSENLQSEIAVLAIVHSLVKSGQFPTSTKDFDAFSNALELVTEQVRAILSDESSVSYLEKDDYISLHYMKIVTSITQSIHVLIKVAYSPQVRAQFFSGKKLDIELVSSSTQILDFPQNKEDYQQLADSVLFSLGDHLQGDEGAPPNHIMNNPSREVTVHSECTLLLHLIKCSQDNESFHCLPFIGCSKLSCVSCFFFFESVRVVMGVNFQVGGSHGKIYPWVFPGTARREIDGNTAQQVQKHFTGRFKRCYLEVVRQKQASSKSSPAPSDSNTDYASIPIDSQADRLRDKGYEIP